MCGLNKVEFKFERAKLAWEASQPAVIGNSSDDLDMWFQHKLCVEWVVLYDASCCAMPATVTLVLKLKLVTKKRGTL